jgi:hypothetical protein
MNADRRRTRRGEGTLFVTRYCALVHPPVILRITNRIIVTDGRYNEANVMATSSDLATTADPRCADGVETVHCSACRGGSGTWHELCPVVESLGRGRFRRDAIRFKVFMSCVKWSVATCRSKNRKSSLKSRTATADGWKQQSLLIDLRKGGLDVCFRDR